MQQVVYLYNVYLQTVFKYINLSIYILIKPYGI